METVLSILQEFDDTEVLITGCRVVALVALGKLTLSQTSHCFHVSAVHDF